MRSRGVALVTVLLIVAIATLAATALLSTSSLAIHRTASLRDSEQAWWLAWSGQSLALAVLEEAAKNSKIDSEGQPWNMPVDYPVDNGGIRGRIIDQQGLFNLNNLVSTDPATANEAAQQFLWLTAVLNIQPARDLLTAIRDWADADDVPGQPGGAEDATYLGREVPYRAANRRFVAASELLAVAGVTPEIYRALRPFVTALPADTKINVNTAPYEILMALCSQPDEGKTRAFIQARRDDKLPAGTGPAQDIPGDFVPRNTCGGIFPTNRLDVRSSYFRIEGEAFIGSSRVALYSLMFRPKTGAPTVLSFSTDGD